MKKFMNIIELAIALILLAITLPVWLLFYAVNGFTPNDFFSTVHLAIKRVWGEEEL